MRHAFIETLCSIAECNPHVWLLCGDLGYSVLERFVERFPKRYVNVGVAEQNMTGIAAGLALAGKTVFTYSIANFPTFRCLEQIRNDVCYHNLDVKIVAVGGGLAYGPQGATHHGIQDLAIMRALPAMRVMAPGDPIEVAWAVQTIVQERGPFYLRLGKGGEPRMLEPSTVLELGRANTVRDGSDVTLISTGGILPNVVAASDQLAQLGVSARVLSMHTVKPLDAGAIITAAEETQRLVTVEEHSLVGGLGSAVAEILSDHMIRSPLTRLGLPDRVLAEVGSQAHLRDCYGLSVAKIVHEVERLLSASYRS